MSQKSHWLEFNNTLSLVRSLPTSSLQIHKPFEADCEILKFKKAYWALSTDSIGEEIDQGLYKDPFLWGWMTVMGSISDLAATGSQALGILLANQWKYKTTKSTQLRFFKGVQAALRKSRVPLLGGDSGLGASHCHTSTIIGTSRARPLTRLNARPGDSLCLVGKRKTGNGPALAISSLFPNLPFSEKHFRPEPPILVMQRIAPLAHASIDTSDGVGTSLALLSQINKLGLEIHWNSDSLTRESQAFARKNKIHPMLLWLSDLGDLQTLICLPPKNLSKALRVFPDLVPIGKVTREHQGILIQYEGRVGKFPIEKILKTPRSRIAIRKTIQDLNKELFKAF